MARRKPLAHGEGSIYETGDGRWRGNIVVGHHPDGRPRRRYASGASYNEVDDKLKLLRGQKAGGSTETRNTTVEQWLRYWLMEIAPQTVAPQTIRSTYRPKIENHVLPRIGRKRIDQLQPEDFEGVYKAMRDEGLAASTCLQTHRILHAAFKAAARRKKIPNPVDLAIAPKVTKKEIKPFEVAEAEQIVKHLKAGTGIRQPARWAVALGLGLRQGEVLGLRWDDVDFDAATLTVRYQLKRMPPDLGDLAVGDTVHTRHADAVWTLARLVDADGWLLLRPANKAAKDAAARTRKAKGAKRIQDGCLLAKRQILRDPDAGLMLLRPKTKKTRVIAVPASLVEMLRQHRADQRRLRLQEGPRWVGWATQIPHGEGQPVKADLVFPGWGGRPVDPSTDSKAWHDLLDLVDVQQLRLHDARHTAATLLLAAGVPARVVQEILGHSQIAMTMQYTHVVDEMRVRAAAAMDTKLFGAPAAASG